MEGAETGIQYEQDEVISFRALANLVTADDFGLIIEIWNSKSYI